MIVAGLDLSLTATGVAILNLDQNDAYHLRTLSSKPEPKASLAQRLDRIVDLANRIVDYVTIADIVAVEGPSLGQARQGGTFDRSGLWWLVVTKLAHERVNVAEIPPAVVKKYSTGKGNASKDQVLLAVARRYPEYPVADNNQADALILAAMAARALNKPIEPSLPVLQATAVTRVAWPFATEVPF